jgi:Ala-tRNA(Pro) deacylase
MDDNPRSEVDLYALFDAHGISYEHHVHPPLHTVEESKALRGDIRGAHVKNMFLKDKKGQFWLVTCLEHRNIRIRDLEKKLSTSKASFGKPEALWEMMGIRPGAVSPFGLINDPDHAIRVVLDKQMLEIDPISAHPLHNEATTTISATDFRRFFEITGHTPEIVDFDALEELERERRANA